MLGISLYPDKTTLAEDEAYLTRARALGYRPRVHLAAPD